MIERLILTGLITSTEYCQQIRNIWNVQFMEADSAKRLAPWVWEYFEQWGKAPGTEDIYPIFFTHVKHLPEREAKDVEGMQMIVLLVMDLQEKVTGLSVLTKFLTLR